MQQVCMHQVGETYLREEPVRQSLGLSVLMLEIRNVGTALESSPFLLEMCKGRPMPRPSVGVSYALSAFASRNLEFDSSLLKALPRVISM